MTSLRFSASVFTLIGVIACQDSAGPKTDLSDVAVVAGDAQTGIPGTPLPNPITFAVSGPDQTPSPGVAVRFVVTAGAGTVPSSTAVTDARGEVSTTWTLGSGAGDQILEARVTGLRPARATASTIECAECPPPSPPIFDVIALLNLSTYDHSGQVVHPDVALAGAFGGFSFWLGITPYPNGNAGFENPSIFQSANGLGWSVPVGATNPIELPTSGYLSDPDIVFDPEAVQLWLYYRQVIGGRNVVHLRRSDDGIHWSSPSQVVSTPSHEIVSPTVVHGAPHAAWAMWSINSGPAGCTASRTVVERRTSVDGEHWSAPLVTDLAQPGQLVWHIDVQWIPARHEYWALYNTYPAGGTCVTDALYLARSVDGMRWTTYPSPLLSRGATDEFRDIVYRSTFAVDPTADAVQFWFSGASYNGGGYTWRAATEFRRVTDVLTQVQQPRNVKEIVPRGIDLPPPEPADMPAEH
ncbi:MAG TPA: hypothetical protein VH438_09715 [Gemmatimonadales bacterium]